MAYYLEDSTFLLYLTILLINICESTSLQAECPCKIDKLTATSDCSHKHLIKVPDCVSNSTRGLILYNNSFKVLYSRQFERFTELRNLNLVLNDIKYIRKTRSWDYQNFLFLI